MTIEAIPHWIFKHGISGVLVVWLFMTNARLSDVEARLYSCYEKQFVRQISDNQKKNIRHRELVALLTDGRVQLSNLPTSATGLSIGELWNDSGTIKIV